MHRFQIERVDEHGRTVRVPDTEYAELSLRMRRQADPRAVFNELARTGRVQSHEDRAAMLAAVAIEAAQAHVDERGHALSVASNEDAELINQAVLDWLVDHGEVDSTVSVTGSDGLAMCAGERVMTRKNDTDLEVANRQSWIINEIAPVVASSSSTTTAKSARSTRNTREIVFILPTPARSTASKARPRPVERACSPTAPTPQGSTSP